MYIDFNAGPTPMAAIDFDGVEIHVLPVDEMIVQYENADECMKQYEREARATGAYDLEQPQPHDEDADVDNGEPDVSDTVVGSGDNESVSETETIPCDDDGDDNMGEASAVDLDESPDGQCGADLVPPEVRFLIHDARFLPPEAAIPDARDSRCPDSKFPRFPMPEIPDAPNSRDSRCPRFPMPCDA